MFVSFEGIDGSGKTTLSNLVCERLRGAGHEVRHAREKGVLASGVARRVRELTRDGALVEMSPRAEMFLNLAREAQQLEEIVRPALARGAVCVADRSLHSLVALAASGRGLPRAEVDAAAVAAAAGTWPDLVVLVDVDPDVARLRKRVGKILDGRDGDAESRKGLAGAGLAVRIRRHLLAKAAGDPRWILCVNEGRPLEEIADGLATEILRRLATATGTVTVKVANAAAVPTALPLSPTLSPRSARDEGEGRRGSSTSTVTATAIATATPTRTARPARVGADPDAIAAHFFAALDALSRREPALAAHLLAGIPGADANERRAALASRVPRVVARALRGLRDRESLALRRTLAVHVPADVAAGLAADLSIDAMTLRRELVDAAPAAVAGSLARNGTAAAWALRDRALERGAPLAAMLTGVAGVDDPRAWALRADGLRRELWDAVGRSLTSLASPRADVFRTALAERDRLAAVRGTEGIDGDVARTLRERLFPHAPKRVLRSLAGVDAEYAWSMREAALHATKEPLDSVDGMDHPRAWALREVGLRLWPATAISSLRELAPTGRGLRVVARALEAAPGSIVALRNAHAALSRARAGEDVSLPQPPMRAVEESCTS